MYLTSLRSAPGFGCDSLVGVCRELRCVCKVSNHPSIRPSLAPYMRESIEHWVLLVVQSI